MTPEAWLANVRREREEIAEALRKVTEYADQPISAEPGVGSLAIYVRELVRDHEELESRIEAVLTLPTYGGEFIDKAQVHHLLRGGKRIPDTIEEIEP